MASTPIAPSPAGSCSVANTEGQPERVPPILNIPVELLTKICEVVIEIPKTGPWSSSKKAPRVGLQDLAHLTRVCRAFRSVAGPVLFRHFDITWPREFERTNKASYFEDIGVYTDTQRFFRFLNAMKKNGSADLVRYLDVHAISNELAFSDWNMNACYRGQPYMGGDSELLDELLWQLGGFQVIDRQHVDVDKPIGTCRETTGRSVLLTLLLSTFRNVLAARLPVDPGTANLFDRRNKAYCIEDKYNSFWDGKRGQCLVDRVLFSWTGLEGNLKSPAFPHLTELELIGHVETMSHEMFNERSLRAVHLAYMVNNTPRLKTLRLFGFSLIDLGPTLDLGKITTLVLKECSVSYREVHRLAIACTKLKTFKISSSEMDIRARPHIWEGEEGFEETHFGHHIDDVNDPEENAILRLHAFPHIPWGSNLVGSSLVLQALSPASQTLENIIIGRCGPVLVDVTKGLNCKRRRMDCTKFEFLRDLGIWFENLFLYDKSNDEVLSEIVRGAGRLNCLSIFMREGALGWTVGGNCVLERALARLALDLESGKVKTYLQKIRIFRMQKENLEGRLTLVSPSYVDSDLESWYDETTSGDEDLQPGEEIQDQQQETTPSVEEEIGDLGPSTVERLADHDIELVHIEMSPEDGSGDHPYGTLFPNDAEADYFLWDHLF